MHALFPVSLLLAIVAVLVWQTLRARRAWRRAEAALVAVAKGELALRESEDRFRTAFAHAAVGMSVTDPAGRILEVNPAICQILGYTAGELLNLDVLSITHPKDRDATVKWQERARASVVDHVHFQLRALHKNGDTVWLQVSRGTVRDADHQPICFIALLVDITHERRAADLARENEERWHLALEATNDGIWDWDATTNEVYYSARWKQMLGFEEQELPNRPEVWEQLVHPEDLPRAKAAVERHLTGHTLHYMAEYRIRCKDGAYRWVLARGKAIWDATGRPTRMIGAHGDITDRKSAEEKLFHRASFDSLTGLMNRGHFLASLEKAIVTAHAEGLELTLCLCDVDNFKSINDRFGHRVGDDVLVSLAGTLQQSLHSFEIAGRLGGDEFCTLLPGTNISQAAERLERVRERFHATAFGSDGNNAFGVTASFGVASLTPGMTSIALIEAADRALYTAKEEGRNCIASAEESLARYVGRTLVCGGLQPACSLPGKATQ